MERPDPLPSPGYPPGQSEPAKPQPPPPSHPQPDGQSRRRGLGAVLAALLALAAKGKALLLLLPKLKLFTSAGTMLVSIAAYTVVFGLPFALGFVALLFVHEMGHVIQLRREGVKASAPMFIPFLGAVISARSLGGNALAEARVGLAGPVLGSLAAVACVPLHTITHDELFRALAFTGFFLNLFNLLPVVPLDGGRAMAAMAPWMWFAGLAAMAVIAVVFPNPVMIIILLFAALETRRRWRDRKRPESADYYKVAPVDRALVAAVFIALVALLAVGMDATRLDAHF